MYYSIFGLQCQWVDAYHYTSVEKTTSYFVFYYLVPYDLGVFLQAITMVL